MELLIITGLSGAGKSKAIGALEDLGFYCIDNMPPQLIGQFADIFAKTGSGAVGAAVVTDLRGGELFGGLFDELASLKSRGVGFKLLFLDADNRTLVRRYHETRRKHPLIEKAHGDIAGAVKEEREILSPAKSVADYILDTSLLSNAALKDSLGKLFLGGSPRGGMSVICQSFGFKHGGPTNCDLVFDVRCLPNPFYEEELKALTGKDKAIADYIMGYEQSRQMLEKIRDLVDFSLPLYRKEGKSLLSIGFGCTGGKHRSVLFAELLGEHLGANVIHRDINKR